MDQLWEATQARSNADKDLDAAREQIEGTRQQRANDSKTLIEATIDTAVNEYQTREKSVLDFYRSDAVKDKFNVDPVLQEAPAKTKKLLQDFLATGKVPSELSSMLINGSLTSVRDNERQFLLASISGFQQQLQKAQQELELERGKLKKISSKPRGGFDGEAEVQPKDDDQEYGLLGALRGNR
jgi:hypothetical protein